MEARTTRCHNWNHPEFVLIYDADLIPEPDIQWFLDFLHQDVASGARYKHGETIQVGWMQDMLEQLDSGELTLLEPNMKDLPIKYVKAVNLTLQHVRRQKDSADSLGLLGEICFPSLMQRAIVCNELEKSKHFCMSRTRAEKGMDSGWFIGCLGNEHDHNNASCLVSKSLYEAALSKPQAIDFLALPPETELSIFEEKADFYHRGRKLRPKARSYLFRKFTPSARN